jgi:hypothetical protein
MKHPLRFLARVLRGVPRLVYVVLIGWLFGFVSLFEQIWRRQRLLADQRQKRLLPPYWVTAAGAYARPDPLLYSQPYLLSLGLSVTWDNPDIEVRQHGKPVPAEQLAPNTEYEVLARIWNNSTEAPAINMPVSLAYHAVGINIQRVPVAETHVDVPVKGTPGLPAVATFRWHTPATPANYRPVVELRWPDDANPQNNLGYKNTLACKLASSQAEVQLAARNDQRERWSIQVLVDSYQITPPPPSSDQQPAKHPTMRLSEAKHRLREAQARFGRDHFPLPQGWRVTISPNPFTLEPGAEQIITVTVTAPPDFQGRQAINLTAFDGPTPRGGVTLYVEG